jgi:succinate dehydrogenase hydrophobic anchor subunit
MSSEKDAFTEREIKNTEVGSKYMIHWITQIRKRGLGMWAWLLQRLTAILMVFGFFFHILAFQFGLIIPGGSLITVDLLLFTVVYHMLNGIRVILIEVSDWAAEREETLFIIVLIATIFFLGYWIFSFGL